TNEQIQITRMVSAPDGSLLLVGTNAGSAFFMKLGSDGTEIWEKSIRRELPGIIFDAIPMEDGGAIVVGDFWGGDPFFMSKSLIWIGRVDLNGQVKIEKTFAGRRPRIAKGADGSLVVVYDEAQSAAQQIKLQALSKNLDQTWSASIFRTSRG